MLKIDSEIITQIKQIVDPESILTNLGFHFFRKTGKELRGPCKVHGGDNPTAFRFNLNTRTWCCYTKHCEGSTDRDLIGLVQKVQGTSFIDSVKFLADFAGIDLNNQKQLSKRFVELKYEQEMRKEKESNVSKTSAARILSEEILEEFENKRSNYFTDREFPSMLLDFYEVGGTTDSKGIHRETIPVRDEKGNLITVSMRRTDSDVDPKYILLENVRKGDTLYNLHIAKDYVGEDRTLILVEGFVDVWALCVLGVYNVVAAMGTDITPNQRFLLWKYAENIIILMDGDSAGRLASERIKKFLENGAAEVKVVLLPDGKDPKHFTYKDVKTYILEENYNARCK